MNDRPLVYTTRGNLPADELTYATQWERTDDYIKFVETYTAPDGEVVRQSAHVLALKSPFGLEAIAGESNG